MDVGRLIECVRKHVFLYDTFHKEYNNPNLKIAAWDYIGKELNESSDACKQRWKTVRDGYTKYKKQLAAGKPVMAYIWNDKLKFLDYYNVCRNTKCRKKPAVAPDQSQDDSMSATFGSLLNFPESNSSALSHPDKSRTEVDDLDSTKHYNNRVKSKDYDAIDHLFLSYSETFKTFSQKQQIFLKIKLAKLFACAEMERLGNNGNLEMNSTKKLPILTQTNPKCRAAKRRKKTTRKDTESKLIERFTDETMRNLGIEQLDSFEHVDIDANEAHKSVEISPYTSIKSENTEESKHDQLEAEENTAENVSPVKTEYTEVWTIEAQAESHDDDSDNESDTDDAPSMEP